MISNAKQTMDPASGYWADPIPVMEQPLCAVIDPVRDYRWHALRCGGPETAAFLCEMEGEWAWVEGGGGVRCYLQFYIVLYNMYISGQKIYCNMTPETDGDPMTLKPVMIYFMHCIFN